MRFSGFLLAGVVLTVGGLLTAGARQSGGATLVERVAPRPRLLFAAGEFQRLGEEITGARRDAFQRLTAEIDERGTRNWNERDLQLASQALAARLLLDRSDRRGATYLGYARQTLQSLLGTHTYIRYSQSHDLVTEGSRWLEAMALAHDWLYPHLSAEERSAIARWLSDEVEHWVDTNRLVRASASPFRNDLARGVSGLVLAALTLYDEPAHEGSARKALGYAQPFYESIVAAHPHAGAGGGMAEGTFYGNFTAWSQTLVAEALYTAAGVSSAYTRTPFYAARLRYAVHGAWPGYLTNQFGYDVHQLAPVFGDARRGPTGSALYHRATVLLLGKRFKSTDAARQAYWAVNRAETNKTYTREWALYDLLFWSPEVTASAPRALSYHERTLGQVFARSDWSDEATWLSFNAGPHLDTHQHYDAGNLTLYRGVDLLVDSGSFDAFGSTHWHNYYVRTVAHNTITVTDPQERWEGIWGGANDDLVVNDGGQRTAAPLTPAPTLQEYLANRTAYDHGRIERYSDGAWGAYVRANLTNAYQNPQYQSARPDGSRNRVKVSHVGREVVYLRGSQQTSPPRGDAIVVFDRVVSADPSFRKAVLWHAREPFKTALAGKHVAEGDVAYEGASRYEFETVVGFTQGKRQARGRLTVTVLPVDSVRVRQIGLRPPTPGTDHTTFGVAHKHRHVKDYLVEDPRGVVNRSSNMGAPGRPEWPPFNPPEQQWLWTDDLVGGWGQTRLQVEPDAARTADRFLTVLVPADDGAGRIDAVSASSTDGGAAGVLLTGPGGRGDVVMFSADPNGGDLKRGSIDLPARARAGDLVIASLTPGARYEVRAGTSGAVTRIAVSESGGGDVKADEGGIVRLRLEQVSQANAQAAALGGGFAAAGGTAAMSGSAQAHDRPTGSGGSSAPTEQDDRARAPHPGLITVAADTDPALTEWDRRVSRMARAGQLRLRETVADALIAGRQHQRYSQLYKGVPVFGGELSRQMDGKRTVSVFGTLYEQITIDPVPKLTSIEAAGVLQKLSGGGLGPSRTPELVVLPTDAGAYQLAYRARVATAQDVRMIFIDANTGEEVLSFSDLERPVL